MTSSFLADLGILGLLALLIAGALALLTIGALFAARTRAPFRILLVASLAPFLVAGTGALFGHRAVMDRVELTAGAADPREVAEGRRSANVLLITGACLSVGLALFAAVALAAKRDDAEPLL